MDPAVYRLIWMVIGAAALLAPAILWWHLQWWGDVLVGMAGFFLGGPFLAGLFEMTFLGGRAPGK
jgi:hypothetical protein